MKVIIELTPQQIAKLKKENKANIPLPSYLRSVFKFKSVEIIQSKDTSYQDILYRVNRNKQA